MAQLTAASETTLQAVIANRYEVMARYSKTLRKTFDAEYVHMRELASQYSDQHLWLYKDEAKLTANEKARLEELILTNKSVRLMVEMRRDLSSLWERSHVTKEQLTTQLQAWCQRAEASGMTGLQDFSLRLRRYTI